MSTDPCAYSLACGSVFAILQMALLAYSMWVLVQTLRRGGYKRLTENPVESDVWWLLALFAVYAVCIRIGLRISALHISAFAGFSLWCAYSLDPRPVSSRRTPAPRLIVLAFLLNTILIRSLGICCLTDAYYAYGTPVEQINAHDEWIAKNGFPPGYSSKQVTSTPDVAGASGGAEALPVRIFVVHRHWFTPILGLVTREVRMRR